MFCWHTMYPPLGEGGGYFWFQVKGMIEWGQKSNPPKNPYGVQQNQAIPGPKINPQKSHAEFLSLKKFQKVLNDITCLLWLVVFYSQNHARSRYTGTTTNLHIVLNTEKTQKHICPILLAKNIPESKISNPKKIVRSSRSLEVQSTPLPFSPSPRTMKNIPCSIGQNLSVQNDCFLINRSHTEPFTL